MCNRMNNSKDSSERARTAPAKRRPASEQLARGFEVVGPEWK